MASGERRISGTCKCGRPIVKILNSDLPTMWVNGDRYIYSDRPHDRGCIFRCDNCSSVIDEVFREATSGER